MRAVIDTNIWRPSLAQSCSLNQHEEGVSHAVISEPIIEELVEVLSRLRIEDK